MGENYGKNKSFKSKENIEFIKQQRCIACGKAPPNDAHHLRTRKSGGGDQLWNLLPLDRRCHQESHFIGQRSFANKYRLPVSWDSGFPKRTDL